MDTFMKRNMYISALAVSAFAATSAFAANPYADRFHDDDWISVTGEVASTSQGEFTLEYDEDEGFVTVEMDDWDSYDEANRLSTGEKVTVHGAIDDDAFEKRRIEAGSVYAHDRSTYYLANAADEENIVVSTYVNVEVPDGTLVNMKGEVGEVRGREFDLKTPVGNMVVDTDEMSQNPLDNEGFQQIDSGDRVSVSGRLDLDLFEKREIKAEHIMSLDSKTLRGQSS